MSKGQACIVGGGFQNKGAEAMLLTVTEAVQRRFGPGKVSVRVPAGDFAAARAAGVRPVKSDAGGRAGRFMSKVRTAGMIARGATLIDISGFQFGDDWPANAAERRAETVRQFTRIGNRVFFMPQAWGPFKNKRVGKATKAILDTATFSFVRDNTSMQAVDGLVGRDHPRVQFAHDLAWNFQGDDLAVGAKMIAQARLPIGRLTVAVTPNMRVYERSEGQGPANAYVRFLVNVIEHLCTAHSARIVLLGHELRHDGSPTEDDRSVGEMVMSALDRTRPVVHLRDSMTAAEIKSVLGNCDLVVASRYHALVAALSQCIPVAAAGWSHKYLELLRETGGGVTLSASDQAAGTRATLDRLVDDRQSLQATLERRVPAIRRNSAEALERVMAAIAD